MSADANKALVRGFIDDVINGHNAEAVRRYCAPDVTVHRGAAAQQGVEAIQRTFAMLLAAFPDARYELDVLMAEDDLVTDRGVMRGTHSGPLMGLPPTGKPIEMTVTNIVRIKDGRIVEHWGQEDMLALMQQLGMVPAMGGRPH